MDIYYDKGIILEGASNKLLLDPDKKCLETDIDFVFVSHPHADHYGGVWEYPYIKKIMNFVTYEIVTFRNPRKQLPNVQFIGEELAFENFTVKTYPAGHTIGSIQFELTFEGKRIAFTGDFCIQSRLGIEKGVIIQHPDILIIDSTYGTEEYVFPDRTEVYRRLLEWVMEKRKGQDCPIISARLVGTAQEITKLLNSVGQSIDVCVHSSIFHLNGIFKKYSKIGNATKHKIEEVINRPNTVYISPFWNSIDEVGENIAVCSGWLVNDSREHTFPLSNHGGFDQILTYIKESQPKKVLTVYGNKETLARYLRREGYDAEAL